MHTTNQSVHTSQTQNDDRNERLVATVLEELQQVQAKQEEIVLDPLGGIPINFSGMVNPILAKLDMEISDRDEQREVIQLTADRIQQMYDYQLESLRDYCGRLYEDFLDSHDPSLWKDKASQLTEQFRKAAESAIPKLSQKLLNLNLDYLPSLQGLIADMMSATSMRQPEDNDDDEIEEGPRVRKWYEKLAARALVLGVNYLQGWLAYEGIKRAAVERERIMPKFPLF